MPPPLLDIALPSPSAHKSLWTGIPYCTVFRFLATLGIVPQIVEDKDWRYTGIWMCCGVKILFAIRSSVIASHAVVFTVTFPVVIVRWRWWLWWWWSSSSSSSLLPYHSSSASAICCWSMTLTWLFLHDRYSWLIFYASILLRVGIETRYGPDSRGSNPGGGEIFRKLSDQPCDPIWSLYNWNRVFFPGVKRPGRGVNHSFPSSAEVKERVEVAPSPPSGTLWAALGWILHLPYCWDSQ